MNEKVKSFSKPASSVKHTHEVVRSISRADSVVLNATVEPKIRQNALMEKMAWQESKNAGVLK